MITHCPSCHTHFRVHTEQLTARAGQVRCGKCNRVFDALEYLIEEIAPAREPSAAQESAPKVAVAVATEPVPESAPDAVTDVGAEPQAPATAASTGEDAETTEAEIGVFEPAVHESAPEPQEGIDAEPAYGASSFDFGPIAAADPARRARRWPWLLGALLLLLILLAQATYQYRSTLLVLFPEAKPYAVKLCASLGCELPLPRRIEQMSIEASDLQADTANPNIMVLSATLKNRAVFEQLLPSLELTLTDAQDQPVVRRVLAPKDYIGKAADTQTGFPANSEIAIKVFIEGSQVKATGYRLYLFYP
ncbi:MAG: zinc-ribbon domain-containing protein [Burkholderiales bacterium]|nr:zinc-ribbon domain-containing protein [Burkholderiales bacterium]